MSTDINNLFSSIYRDFFNDEPKSEDEARKAFTEQVNKDFAELVKKKDEKKAEPKLDKKEQAGPAITVRRRKEGRT